MNIIIVQYNEYLIEGNKLETSKFLHERYCFEVLDTDMGITRLKDHLHTFTNSRHF